MPRPKKGDEHPQAELANQIGLLVAIGTTHEQIARILKMGLDTLHKHYKDDLELGSAKAGAVVGGKIFEAAKRGEQWACTLWAARRMGWKETTGLMHSGPDGGAIPVALDIKPADRLKQMVSQIAERSGEAGKPSA